MRIGRGIKKILFRLRWLTMTPRQRYAYLLVKSGSLRERR